MEEVSYVVTCSRQVTQPLSVRHTVIICTQSIPNCKSFDFSKSSLIIRLIQSFVQNITFLLCIDILIKVLQE